MAEIITQIIVEVVKIFGIATKELKRGSASEFRIVIVRIFAELCVERFFRKLAGMADLEDSLKKLDRLTQEEARMALSEVLKITHNTRDEVRVVDGKVENVGDKVANVGNKVEGVGDKVEGVGGKVDDVGDKVDAVGDQVDDVRDKVEDIGDKVDDVGDKVVDVGDKVEDLGDKVEDLGDNIHCVHEKLQVVIDRARGLSPHSLIPSNNFTFRRQPSKRRDK